MDSDEFKSIEEDVYSNKTLKLNTELIKENNIERSNEETSISLNNTTIENASNSVSVSTHIESVDNNQDILNSNSSISSNKSNEDSEKIEKNKVINSLVSDNIEIIETNKDIDTNVSINNESNEKINISNDFDSDEF